MQLRALTSLGLSPDWSVSETGCCDLPCAAPPYRESILPPFPRLSYSVLQGVLSALHSEPWHVQTTSGKNIHNTFSEVTAAEGEFSKVGSCHGPLNSCMDPHQTQGKATGQNQVTIYSCTWNYLPCQKSLL